MSLPIDIYAEHATKTLLDGPPFTDKATKLDPIYRGDLLVLKVHLVDFHYDYYLEELRYHKRVIRYAGATVAARLGYFDQSLGRQTIVDATGWTEFNPSTGAATVVRNIAGTGSNPEYQYADFPSEPSGVSYFSGTGAAFNIYWGELASVAANDSNGVFQFQRVSATRLAWNWVANGARSLASITTLDFLPGWAGFLNLTAAGVATFLGTRSSRQAFLEIRITPSAGDAEVVFQVPVLVKQSLLA